MDTKPLSNPWPRAKNVARTSALLSVLLLAGAACRAQQDGPPDLTTMSIEELTRIKVVTASRHAEEKRWAPSSMSSITAGDIRLYGWRTLAEALNSLRGFYTAYDRNYAYVGVRGFRQSDDYGSRVLLMIDGHRVNENVYGSAFIGTDFTLDLALVDRIEIGRGPTSSLYCTTAGFAVINVITRKPKTRAIETSLTGMSLGGRGGRVTAEMNDKKVSAIVSGSMLRSGGYSSLYFPEFDEPATNNGIARNMDGDSNAQGFAAISWGNFHAQAVYGSRRKVVPTASFDSLFNDRNETVDTRAYLDLSYQRSYSTHTDLELRGYFDSYDYSDLYARSADGGRKLDFDHSFARWAGTEITVSHRLGGRFAVTAGGKYEFNVHLETRNQAGTLFGDHSPWLSAEYAELDIKLLRSLTVNAGGRLDSYSAFGTAASPRLALVYSPTEYTSLKYIFGRAFRTPTAYELFDADGVVLEANPKLGPEHLVSHDLVFEHAITSELRFTAEAYVNTMRDRLELGLDPATGLQHFVNDQRFSGRGLEFEIEAKSASGRQLRASYALAQARDTDQTPKLRLANSPMHTAKLHGSIFFWRTNAALELLYTGTQHSDAGAYVPASFLANATISTKPVLGGWQFSASCYNALGRKWFFPAGPEHLESVIRQDGRTFRFAITYRLQSHRSAPTQ